MSWLQDLQHLFGVQDAKQLLLIGMVPVFGLVTIWEMFRFGRTPVYDVRDSLASVALGGSYLLVEAGFYALFVFSLGAWVYEHRLFTIPINGWTFAALFVLGDLCFYVNHRTCHRVRYFWCTHVVHHASEHMNFTTASRQSTLSAISGVWIFYLPLIWLGFDAMWVFFALSLNLAYQYFLHTQWVRRLPAPIEFIFNTPSHHRAHHGRNPRYIDRNYGGTFIVFDRLFGTFMPESEEEPPEYGIVRQVHSYNPVVLTLHEWIAMARDIARPGPLWQRLKHLWKPPEWERELRPAAEQRTEAAA